MNDADAPILVLGASGFLGAHVTAALLASGRRVRGFDCRWDAARWQPHLARGALEVRNASVFDEEALHEALRDVRTVFHLVSFSVPGTSPAFLENELQTTLRATDRLLTAMVHAGATTIVFPSSGGAVYGEGTGRPARETDPLRPVSSYGAGKLLCEQMIHFYSRLHKLRYLIVRPSNPYGAYALLRQSQGVIDVFLEKILAGQPLCVWGNLHNVRDYIHIDDLVEALLRLWQLDDPSSRTVNLGSGRGESLQGVLQSIGRAIGRQPEWTVDSAKYSGVSSCILDISQLQALTGWQPRYSLDQGIQETLQRKRAYWKRRLAA